MAGPVERRHVHLEPVEAGPKRYWRRIVVSQEDAVPLAGGKGFSYVGPAATGAVEIEAGTFEMEPGTGSGKTDLHSHGNEEFSYIVRGEGWIAIEDERHPCRAGDFVFVPAFARHGWWNSGDEPLVVLFYRPVKREAEGHGQVDLRKFRVVPGDPA
jgi:quercetin dioxygenase-like cupin family protein